MINRAEATTFVDEGLIPGRRYYYRLRAVTGSGNSVLTGAVGVTTLADDESPSTPVSVRVERGSLSKAILRWEASSDNVEVSGYEIWANGELIGFSPVPGFEAVVEAGELYEFYVVAVDLSGNKSGESERVNNELFITDAESSNPGGARLTIYPNPGSSQQITFSYTGPASGTLALRLTDIQNRELMAREIPTTGGVETLLPVGRYLPDGLYILSVRQNEINIKAKIIIRNE
jgi:hypothetical protein